MRPESPLWHAKHVVRAFLLLFVGIITLVLLRSLLIPDSWGESGWFRHDNVTEQRAKPLRHGGNDSCLECHDEEYAVHAGAGHASVTCEGCHAAILNHVADGEWVKEMPVHLNNELCLGCHRQLNARPGEFPQVRPREHVDEQDGTFGPQACFDCHEPHEPL